MLAIYCRISKDSERDKNRSIRNQEELGIKKANELKTTYKVYKDEGVSGTLKIDERPAFNEMLDDIASGIVKSVFATEQDRIERSPQTRYAFIKILKDANVKLYTSSGLQNLDDENTELLGDLVSLMNQFYVKLTKRKIKRVLHQKVKKGKSHGILPYGYGKNDFGIVIIDKEESEIIKDIYSMSLNGIGTRSIAEELNKRKIPTRYNKIEKGTLKVVNKYTGKLNVKNKKDIKWSGNTIRNIIKNEVYKGVKKFGDKLYEHPIIIDPIYWKKVNDNLVNNRNNTGKTVRHKYMLKGLLECSKCGRNMYGRTRLNKKDNYYMCSSKRYKNENCGNRSINIDVLENFIWDVFFVKKELLKAIEKMKQKENETKDTIENGLSLKTNHLEKILKRERNILKFLSEEVISVNQFEIQNEEIQEEKSQIELQIYEIKSKLKKLNDENFSVDKLNSFDSIKEFSKKREIINKYIKRIKINYDDKILHYAIDVVIDYGDGIIVPYVMHKTDRVPYVDLFKTIKISHHSKELKENIQAYRNTYNPLESKG